MGSFSKTVNGIIDHFENYINNYKNIDLNLTMNDNLPDIQEFIGEYLEEIENIQKHSEKTMDLSSNFEKEIINARLIANDTLLNTNIQMSGVMEDSFSMFDTGDFPVSIEDLEVMPNLYYEPNLLSQTSFSTSEIFNQTLSTFKRSISIESTWSNLNEEVPETLTLPVININENSPQTQYQTLAIASNENQNIPTTASDCYFENKKSPSSFSGSDSESMYSPSPSPSSGSEMSDFEESPERRRSSGGNSSSDLDQDYEPKRPLIKPGKIKGKMSPKPQHTPTPQNRAAGTSMKITQWILTLLRNPEFNPSIIAWKDEKEGIFHINDTDSFARLWGAHKKNDKMTYEKLSRSMRYSYRNKELESVRNIRLTYKFGPNMKFKAKNLSKTNSVRYQREA